LGHPNSAEVTVEVTVRFGKDTVVQVAKNLERFFSSTEKLILALELYFESGVLKGV
jgi:hypothetical protein